MHRPLTDIELEHLSILGWLTEFFQAAYLMWDDIMDGSETRRGKPCWYRQETVGLSAINDACLVKSSILVLLRKHFQDHPTYSGLVELFGEAAFWTELGQLSDTATSNDHNIADMTMRTYDFITEKKTAFYTFYLPVALALHYFQRATKSNLAITQELLFRMGRYFQIQDDYLDVFGDPKVTGKVGTDIQDNKCSWIGVKAFGLCNSEQKAILSLCYGRQDPRKEARVKDVFQEVDVKEAFGKFEESELQELEKHIGHVREEDGLARDVFISVLGKIRGRNK